VVRRREIPRDTGKGDKGGEAFFRRELSPMEKPREGLKMLEVKAVWGKIVLDARQFEAGEMVTVGDAANASFRLSVDRTPGEVFTLASPGGPHGFVIQVASGMDIEVMRDGQPQAVDGLPSQGAVRTYALGLSDRVRVSMGQLAFIIQYVSPVQPVRSPLAYSFDDRVARWFVMVLIVAVGMWLAIEATPKAEAEVSDYLKNPARFAQLIMPTQREDKKKSFEEIKKKQEEKKLVDDSGKWKKVTAKEKANTKEIPREVKREMDRKVATNAGILGLLAKKGGGTGDNASSVFGGSALTNIDQALASMNSTGMGDSSGFGGMGTRGGGPGGGGGGLGLGGLGTAGYGRGAGAGYRRLGLGHRGRSDIQVVHQNTKVIGALSQEVVGQYIKRYWAQIKFCYERELTKNPNLYGKVTITFTIGGNGRISEAQVMQTTMNNANVEECILRVIRRIIFPQPKGGGQVIVTYPFLFQLAGG
jgi:TonB family protein